ncbi:MAG: tRNA (guanosine(37)-N1)-methyltransferase TrmD [Syntrophomonadaceae bacterium]|nr:tRNA (guanosine(37)-N1)-methyltransferase TrmD [Syntrophomonadaceae bacterium]
MQIDILSLFPEMFVSPFESSIVKRAREKGVVNINLINLRDFARDRHQQVDDYPYGGGAGMVMKADVIMRAVKAVRKEHSQVIYLSPRGRPLSQALVRELAAASHLVLLCGHYEGIDERAYTVIDQEVSIGDYVLTGGEIPAMVVTDAVIRLLPGALGAEESPEEESFTGGLLEYPHYTRPQEVEGLKVPEVLISGHHQNIERWRKKQALKRTLLQRPDLLLERNFDEEERQLLMEIIFTREEHDGQ